MPTRCHGGRCHLMPMPTRDQGGRGARGRALRSGPQSAGSGPPLGGLSRRGRALRSVASVGGVGPSARGVRARRLGCSRRLGRSGALRAQSLRSLRALRRPPSSPPRLPPLACSPPRSLPSLRLPPPPRSAALPPPPSAPRSAALPPPPSPSSLAALPPRPSPSLVADRRRHLRPLADTENPRRIMLTHRGL